MVQDITENLSCMYFNKGGSGSESSKALETFVWNGEGWVLRWRSYRKVLTGASRSRRNRQPMASRQGFQSYIFKEMSQQGGDSRDRRHTRAWPGRRTDNLVFWPYQLHRIYYFSNTKLTISNRATLTYRFKSHSSETIRLGGLATQSTQRKEI